jgi:hypothetical protein
MPACNVRCYQNGAALLLMLLALVVFIGTFMVYSSSDDAGQSRIRQKEQTARALALAKETLLSHAIIDAVSTSQSSPRPGELTCPDKDNDGAADGGNTCTLVGWLPWKTLELEDLRDTADERLWYAVSEDFQDDGNSEPVINSAATFSDLLHILDASGVETGTAAAVIIAPGSPLAGQTRSAGDNEAAAVIQQYLEGTNSDSDDTFTSETASGLNDQIIVITAEELVERAADLAVRQAAAILKDYYDDNGFYPYPEFDTICDINTYDNPGGHQNIAGLLPLTRDGNCPYDGVLTVPSWFIANDWDKVIVYMAAPACAGDTTNNCNGGGFLTLDSQSGIHAMVADSGPVLGDIECQSQPPYDQTRPWPTHYEICEYLETNENTDNDTVFTQPVSSATTNDVFLIVAP